MLGEADAKTLLLKAFALIEYQTMQYADIKGQAELLKTSTGEALDALVALLGLTRQESKRPRPRNAFCWQRHEQTPWRCPPVRE